MEVVAAAVVEEASFGGKNIWEGLVDGDGGCGRRGSSFWWKLRVIVVMF